MEPTCLSAWVGRHCRALLNELERCLRLTFWTCISLSVLQSYAERFGLKQGCTSDLTNGFDFDPAVDRSRAWAIIERDQPLLVIGSPPCTYFSMLNELDKHLHRGDPAWLQRFDENLEKAKRHVSFGCQFHKHQARQGRPSRASVACALAGNGMHK